ncbi:MAG: phage tail protein [Allosphingosinicella sp.]
MATIVLTAVGTAFGGPIGGALGALLGQQVDQRLFAPKARHGPRLGELAVQTSSYGTAIPKIFGLMRVAGTVIWATDLKEHKSKSGGGKGRPKTVEYSYSANFAVALSGRPIRAVRRIWADGKLLRGAGGDFKSETGFRLYPGDEGQAPDPLIVSVEGQAPAHRGIAYAVFEDFHLADYGNRIPSLSFEIEAEAAPVAIGAIAEELSGRAVAAGETMALTGFAASGDSVRGVLESLAEAVPLSLVEAGGRLRIEAAGASEAQAIAEAETGASADGRPARTRIVRESAAAAPGEVAIAYHDAARDYQTGLQRAARAGGTGGTERRALAAVMSAQAAKALAERRLEALWAGRSSARLHLPWRHAAIRPGAALRLPGAPGTWRVARWSCERMAVTLELVRLPAAAASAAEAASPGRPVGQPDLDAGETRLILLDLPLALDEAARGPKLVVAAAGAGAGWRSPALIASFDGGASWDQTGPVPGAVAAGTALTALTEAGSALVDLRGSVDIELTAEAMWLESRSDAALANGANLAALGSEMLQFGIAEPLGGRRFRLSRLLRGRRGTEWAAAGHAAGEPFLLLEPEGVMVIEPPASAVGGAARLIASGLGGEAEAQAAVTGEALRPPAPVHFRARIGPAGEVALRWARRSRTGWPWLSGQDTPLGEDKEAYRLVLTGNGGGGRTVTLAQPAFVYSAAGQQADGASRPLQASLVQIGAYAPSRPAILIID